MEGLTSEQTRQAYQDLLRKIGNTVLALRTCALAPTYSGRDGTLWDELEEALDLARAARRACCSLAALGGS